MSNSLLDFLTRHRIHEVECVIPDMTGIARGKILPKDLFLASGEMRIPKSVLLNTVNGQQPDNGPYVGETDPDMVCLPDGGTVRIVPWAAEPVAVVIHDCHEFRPRRFMQYAHVIPAEGAGADDGHSDFLQIGTPEVMVTLMSV